MTAEYLLENKPPRFQIRELAFLRYWKELVVAQERIREVEERGSLSGDGTEL